MKKIIALSLMFACFFTSYAQKTDTLKNTIQKNAEPIGHGGNNEIKLNLLFTVLGMPEITYERIIGDNMGAGLAVLFNLEKEVDYKFSMTPYYRVYFGNKKASGFFIEANASVITNKYELVYDYYYGSGGDYREETHVNLGLGAAVGGKFLTRNGFLGEAYLGVGRVFGDRRAIIDAYPRVGFTLGKRF